VSFGTVGRDLQTLSGAAILSNLATAAEMHFTGLGRGWKCSQLTYPIAGVYYINLSFKKLISDSCHGY